MYLLLVPESDSFLYTESSLKNYDRCIWYADKPLGSFMKWPAAGYL